MVDRIFPNWKQLYSQHQPLTEGEHYLLKYLDKYLPRDNDWTTNKSLKNYNGWLIFAQPFLNGNRPDIIVFNPFVGGMIIEVKDWNLRNYSWETIQKDKYKKDVLKVTNSKGRYSIKSPLTQVIHYKEIIISQLVPVIGERIDKNKGAYGLFKVACYFHNSTTSNAQEFFKKKVKDFSRFPIFGYDYLSKEENLKKIVPDVIYRKSNNWVRKWNEELLFWFKPPFHSIEQGTPLSLRAEHIRIAEPDSGHYRVKGVAGSGKTQALAYRAAKLASQGKTVLVMTFNITLWHYIKDMVSRAPFSFSWNKITFNYFHGFCRDVLNELGVDWPNSPDRNNFKNNKEYENAKELFFQKTIPDEVIHAVKKFGYRKFDAILIDEGQDFYLEWYSMLNKYFLSSNDELLVVVDKKQNIYQRKLDWFDKRTKKEELIKFKSDIIKLTTSFRLPVRIATMANDFSKVFNLDQELKVAKIVCDPSLIYTDHIVWIDIDERRLFDWIFNAFMKLKSEGESPSDIVILLPNHKIGMECVKFFENKNIYVNHIFDNVCKSQKHIHKKAFWMGDGRLKMSTIHSFKGWELMNIIIFLPNNAPESNKKLDSILYTAFTRSRKNLIIFNSHDRYKKFGKKFPHKWDEQNVYR